MSWLLALSLAAAAQDPPDARAPGSLRAEIESLRVPDVPWRGISWRSCLLDALAESRRTGKPLLAWVFIDRPADDERC